MRQVRLRPVETDDVGAVASLLSHPDLVGRRGLHGDRDAARSVAALTKSVESLVDPEHGDAWVVDVDGVVGLATVGWWWDAHTPWVNVVIDPTHQRRGHGSAAAGIVLARLFGETPALLVEYSVPSWDADALSFADSLGGDRVGVSRRTGVRHRRYVDIVRFALSRAAWEVARGPGR